MSICIEYWSEFIRVLCISETTPVPVTTTPAIPIPVQPTISKFITICRRVTVYKRSCERTDYANSYPMTLLLVSKSVIADEGIQRIAYAFLR